MTTTNVERQLRWCSEWGAQLGGPVWISGPDRKLVYLNARAEQLLGGGTSALVGQRCYEAVAATCLSESFCAAACPLLRLARGRAEIPPVDLRVAPTGSPAHWVRLTAFAFGAAPGKDPYLVHCAVCLESERAILEFLHRIASRSQSARAAFAGSAFRPACYLVHELSPRERQILDLLTADASQAHIAAELHVRPVTVRNHIQHLLAKLGVHSTLEAVALNLMRENAEMLGAAGQGAHPARRPVDP